ncbi:hypothetical protein BC936DRAFT_144802 [Jimgerdemannia flammicorona]|uniref:Uncharacterized protein n=1 Tax=Jimgerdemannia flammicorona TaxID=994334 RepID=A0A433DBN5_9FUNG|nr:hypothetical protein BC936DRAFT_144802 [Jimgerdemannia flammicorona]
MPRFFLAIAAAAALVTQVSLAVPVSPSISALEVVKRGFNYHNGCEYPYYGYRSIYKHKSLNANINYEEDHAYEKNYDTSNNNHAQEDKSLVITKRDATGYATQNTLRRLTTNLTFDFDKLSPPTLDFNDSHHIGSKFEDFNFHHIGSKFEDFDFHQPGLKFGEDLIKRSFGCEDYDCDYYYIQPYPYYHGKPAYYKVRLGLTLT